MIWACHWQLCVLAQWLHLLVDWLLWLVISLALMPWLSCIHICLNTRLNSPILQSPKTINWGWGSGNLPTRCYETNLGWLLLTYLWLWQFQTSRWIYHCECKQRVCFGWCPYCKWTHKIHTYHEPRVRFCYFGWEQPIFLALLLCHLTYLTSGT
jgi:hypothetical protein